MSEINTVTTMVSLADEIKKHNTEKLISFLKEQDLEEKLHSYGMPGGPASDFADFTKECKEKKLCSFSSYHLVSEVGIKLRLWSYGTLLMTSLESMRNEYISTILHTALHITEDKSEDLICIMEDKIQQKLIEGFAHNIKQLESLYKQTRENRSGILQASKAPFSIEFTKESLDKSSEEYQTLHKGLKKVLGIIVGLLKDR
ncbi:20926_t:CDS:2, partial [Dentiscutata erythropus]